MSEDVLRAVFQRTGDHETYKKERWVTLAEADVIMEIARGSGARNFFESGTANGFSACWGALACLQNGCCPVVETWDIVDRPKLWTEPDLVYMQNHIQFHLGPYADAIEQAGPDMRINAPAIFFVDGDHRFHAVKEDIRATLRAAKQGDILLLHDVNEDYGGLYGRFQDFTKTHRTQFFPTERGMGAVWL